MLVSLGSVLVGNVSTTTRSFSETGMRSSTATLTLAAWRFLMLVLNSAMWLRVVPIQDGALSS